MPVKKKPAKKSTKSTTKTKSAQKTTTAKKKPAVKKANNKNKKIELRTEKKKPNNKQQNWFDKTSGQITEFFKNIYKIFTLKISLKEAIITWAIFSVLVSYGWLIFKFVQQYSAGLIVQPLFYELAYNVMYDGLIFSILIFCPVFFIGIAGKIIRHAKIGKKTDILETAFKKIIALSLIISLFFIFLVYMDASNIFGMSNMHMYFCQNTDPNALCIMTQTMFMFLSEIFIKFFVEVLLIITALYGIYRGFKPIIEQK
jgi:hypothetical protein